MKKVNQFLIITALFLFYFQQILAANQPIILVNEKEKYYLQRGNDIQSRFKIDLPDSANDEPDIPVLKVGKSTITFPHGGNNTIVVKSYGKTTIIKINDIEKACQTDVAMGSHKDGNEIRYIAKDGIRSVIKNPIVIGSNIYCIINIHSTSLSFYPILVQMLVVIHTSPTPSFNILRKLNFKGHNFKDNYFLYASIALIDSKLILIEKVEKNNTKNVTNIEKIDKNGKTIKIIAQLAPELKPEKFYHNRWLLCSDSEIKQSTNKQKKNSKNTEACACILLVDTFTLSIFDIKTKKTTKLPKQFIGNNANIIDTNDSMALIRYRETSNNSKFCTIAIPSGKVATIDNEGNGSCKLWKDLVVYKTGNKLKIYNSATGKLVKDLLLPVTMKQ